MMKSKFFLRIALAPMVVAACTIPAQASFFDAVRNLRNVASEIGHTAQTVTYSKQATEQLADEVGLKNSSAANAATAIAEGDILVGKLANTVLYSSNSDSSTVVANLSQADRMVYLGQQKDGFVYVASDKGEGWVKSALVSKGY